MELDIVLWLLKAFSNESSHEGLYPVKLDQTHNIPSSLPAPHGLFICIFTQRDDKRIFHLGADVIQAMGELDGVLLLVLVEHLQLDVELLCLF